MRSPLLLLSAALAIGAPFVAGAAVDSETRSVSGETAAKVPWRGSMVVYEQAATTRSLLRDSQLTWNPVHVHNLSLRPEWHFSDVFFTRVRFDLEQELTDSDYTTRKHELEWSDLFLEMGTRSFKEEATGIVLSGNLRLTVPVSKISASRSLIFGASPSVFLTRSLPVLEGLILRYSARYSHRFYKDTTGSYDGHGIVGCHDHSCDVFANTGVRNSPWDISHGPMVILVPAEGVSLTTMMNWSRAQLYELGDAHVSALTGTEVVAPSPDDPNARYNSLFLVDASWSVMKEFTLSAGFNTMSPQLAPDGKRYNPFVNRYSMVYVNLGLHMDALISNL